MKPTIASPSASTFTTSCQKVAVPCDDSTYRPFAALASMSLVIMSNLTTNETISSFQNFDSWRLNETSTSEIISNSSFYLDLGMSSTQSSESSSIFDPSWQLYDVRSDLEKINSNYDYYDSDNFQDPADENSTSFSSIFNATTQSNFSTVEISSPASYSMEPTDEGSSVSSRIDGKTTIHEERVPPSETPQTHIGIVRCYENICNVCNNSSPGRDNPEKKDGKGYYAKKKSHFYLTSM